MSCSQVYSSNRVTKAPLPDTRDAVIGFVEVIFQVSLEHGRGIMHTLANMLTTPLAYGNAHPWWAFFVRPGGSHGV